MFYLMTVRLKKRMQCRCIIRPLELRNVEVVWSLYKVVQIFCGLGEHVQLFAIL